MKRHHENDNFDVDFNKIIKKAKLEYELDVHSKNIIIKSAKVKNIN